MRYIFYQCLFIYTLISAFLIYIFSVSDYEWMADTNDLVSLCELPVDSENKIVSSLLLILVILALVFTLGKKRTKFVLITQLTATALLFLFWLWRFYLRFWCAFNFVKTVAL